jgi:GntR family transcriptional regulator
MTLTGDELAARLREQIQAGRLGPGDKLASVRTLADQHGVGRGIAQQAMNKLIAEGLVFSRQGAGFYVRDEEKRLVRRAPEGFKLSMDLDGQARSVLRIDEVPAPPGVAENFRISQGEPVVLRRTAVSVGDRTVQVEDAYFPVELVRGTAVVYHDPGEGGIYARLAERGAEVTSFVERVKGRAPSPEEAERLDLRAGTGMVLEVVRLAIATSRVVEVAMVVLDASAVEVVYDLKA